MNISLNILDLRIWVRLGCTKHEKFHPQVISLDIEIIFNKLPQGAVNDDLKDTVCYLELTKKIKAHCASREFNLIEHLTFNVYENVLKPLKQENSYISCIKIIAKKISPPVEDVHGGVTFKYNDIGINE